MHTARFKRSRSCIHSDIQDARHDNIQVKKNVIVQVERLHRFYSKRHGREPYRRGGGGTKAKAYLDEPDCSGFFAETLTTEVEAVFTNETCLVRAEAARDALQVVGRRGVGGLCGESSGRVDTEKRCKYVDGTAKIPWQIQSERYSTPSTREAERPLTTDDFPCHTCGDGKTRQRRASSFILCLLL